MTNDRILNLTGPGQAETWRGLGRQSARVLNLKIAQRPTQSSLPQYRLLRAFSYFLLAEPASEKPKAAAKPDGDNHPSHNDLRHALGKPRPTVTAND